MQGSFWFIAVKNVKRLPQREEIQAGTEPAFGNHKERTCMLREAFLELVSVEENVARLFQTVVIGKVDIVKISGNRCTLSVEFQVGGLYGVLFHVSYSNHKA